MTVSVRELGLRDEKRLTRLWGNEGGGGGGEGESQGGWDTASLKSYMACGVLTPPQEPSSSLAGAPERI